MTLPETGLPFDDENAPLYGVGQVASMLQVQAAFVRRLDTEGVIRPHRSPGGQRRYTQAEVLQVQRVSQLAGEGMTLAGIRRILTLEDEVARLEAELAAERTKRSRRSDRQP
jgi:MerR family transcriptional regulator/heat shock protein HspR